jgi:hypothetical protein
MGSARTTDRIIPKSGGADTILFDDGRTTALATVIRKFNCTTATDDERRYGCYWVVGADGEEYVVTADVSGLRSRTFRICSNSR